ncbi:hypothetical protein V492_06590 [Pseudogymnoascus sp. VKM F-4246]|nr:hypothetical protein V492_06590 [Pseudogymnoascus sp. VKM F-4246]
MAEHADSDEEIPRRIKSDSVVRAQLIILGCFQLSEGVAFTSIFPYIYSMVKSLSGPDSADHNIAIYAGAMVSVFTFGEFVGAPLWAKISDRIGRKPTMLIGSMGAVFSALLFGFSTSLPMAIAARLCAGLLNPNLGVVQTFVGELVSKEQQEFGFSVTPFLRGLGTIIGPVVGGYLAEPVKNYPALFDKGTLWDSFPYLLPNLVVVICLLSSCTLGLLFLEEVHPKFRDQVDIRWTLVSRIGNLFKGKGWNTDEVAYTALKSDEMDVESPQRPKSPTESPEEPGVKPLTVFTTQVKIQILSSAILGFLKVSTLAIVPVFLETPSGSNQPQDPTGGSVLVNGILGIKGGFRLDTVSASHVFFSQAAAAIAGQTLVPAIIRTYGPLQCYKAAVALLLYLYCFLPFTANWSTGVGFPTMLGILWVTKNAVLSPMHLATVNGAAASIGCLARTLGPAILGPLFRFGLQTGYVGLPFWLLGVVSGLGGIVSFYLVDYA